MQFSGILCFHQDLPVQNQLKQNLRMEKYFLKFLNKN